MRSVGLWKSNKCSVFLKVKAMVQGKDRRPELGWKLALECRKTIQYPAKNKNSKFNNSTTWIMNEVIPDTKFVFGVIQIFKLYYRCTDNPFIRILLACTHCRVHWTNIDYSNQHLCSINTEIIIWNKDIKKIRYIYNLYWRKVNR